MISPAAIETAAIAQVVRDFEEPAPWEAWVDAVPVVSDLDDRVDLHPLEKETLRLLPHLQHVCHRPRLHLRVEEERVAVARARRIPARAVASLVAHPGDWEHRTLRGIQPSRVLATQVEDEWNLYENRMAARLVDQLLAWTAERLDELRRIVAMVEEGRDFQQETHGSRFRSKRLYTLWGRIFHNDALSRQLKRTLQTLEALQRDLQALLGSALYTRIPRAAFVAPALLPTNILVNDPHYRKVAALWRAWVRHAHHPSPTREELRKQREDDRRRFETLALLLLVQALSQLGYRPDGSVDLYTDSAADLRGPLGGATLRTTEGEFSLAISGRVLHIVPVLAQPDREDAGARWTQLSAQAGRPEDTAMLLLGRPEDVAQTSPSLSLAFGGWKRPRVLLVSAWSLDCVERLARVLRQWEAQARFTNYPARQRVTPDPGVDLPPWLERVGSLVAVVRPAGEAERSAFGHQCDARRAKLEREQVEAQRAKRAFDPGRMTAIETLRGLAAESDGLERWADCPVCPAGPGRFEHRPAGERWTGWAWWCRCSTCSSEWGLRVCGSCGHAFPVLSPDVPWPDPGEGAPWSIALDRAFGCDLWADPSTEKSGSREFRCPSCA